MPKKLLNKNFIFATVILIIGSTLLLIPHYETRPVFSQGFGSYASCQTREWLCLNDSADYPDVICETCNDRCVYRIPQNPALNWTCPTQQDFGQKDGTAQISQTYYYFDYNLDRIQIRNPLPPPL